MKRYCAMVARLWYNAQLGGSLISTRPGTVRWMLNVYDAVIVGAGPAGLAAGIVLGRNGLRVLVCDRRSPPIDKPCGEGLLPTGLRHLRELDALKHLEADETHPFKGIRVQTASGRTACADFAEGPGLGVRRLNLSRALWRAVQSCKSLEFEETAVQGIGSTPDHMEVQLANRRVQARLVVGADGLNSRVRRWAGLEGGRGGFRRLGARRHFRIAAWSEHVEVIHGNGIEAYITPCGKDLIGVAFLWEPARFGRVPGGPALIPSLLRSFPELLERLKSAPAASPALSTGPLHRLARRRSGDGILLIGDAGGYLDACTGEGISLALAQALALEQSVVPLLRQAGGKVRGQQLAAYEHAFRLITRPYVQATHVLLFLGRHPGLMDRFVLAVRDDPDILQHVFSAQMGQVSFWPGWSRVLRLAVGLVGASLAKPQVARRTEP